MKRTLLLLGLSMLVCFPSWAVHIKGGLISYEYVGPGASLGTSTYRIVVEVFRSCTVQGPNPVSMNIYDAVSYSKAVPEILTSYTLQGTPTKQTYDPCISKIPTPPLCYSIWEYSTLVTLPNNANGYIIAASDANRVTGIINVINSTSTGITFTATIPGVQNNTDYHVNSSPIFDFKDTAVICYSSRFEYQFSATDKDGDRLTYSFGDGLNGTSASRPPPFNAIPYSSGFNGLQPLGSTVKIDSLTGLISGIAPARNGEYVIAVYVHEWRDGVLFNSTKKELQITVADCSLVSASLKDVISCNTYTVPFQNETMATNIISYAWDFGVTNSSADVSSAPTPQWTYADTGTYQVKLTVRNNSGCVDSADAKVKVYPGFQPDFTVTGSCVMNPFTFTDQSFTRYGSINSWHWDFADSTRAAIDTSILSNPSYRYSGPQNTVATLQVTSSMGCSGAISKTVAVFDKAFLHLPFRDTLICSIDTLPLQGQATASSFEWSPNKNISDIHKLNALVWPKDTTVYTLTVRDNGCIDSMKVQVNVLQFIKVTLGLDSGICRTDSFMLRPVSDALSYRWRETNTESTLSNPLVKYPVARPMGHTTYYVTGNLGYCQDSAKITIHVSPYPTVNLGNDTAICYGTRIVFNPVTQADLFTWKTSPSLVNTQLLKAMAGPDRTSSYVLSVRDTAYCKTSVSDTIQVRVVPPFHIDAGKDTSITVTQPLQLGIGGSSPYYTYLWKPADFLSSDTSSAPVATVQSMLVDSIRYVVRATSPEGCTASDDIVVRVFRNGAEIFVPTAFTPNGDGLNDILKPILTGIAEFEYFKVYNRWGQLVYSSTQRNAGWDGIFRGTAQPSDTYIFMTQGKSFDGQSIFRKGTSVLIR